MSHSDMLSWSRQSALCTRVRSEEL